MQKLLKLPVLVNAVLFQILWFACVLGSSYKLIWPAILATGILLIWQLRPAHRHPSDLRLIFVAIFLGLIIDSCWVLLGFMEFTDQRPVAWLSPAWIILMWVGFALTINHSMAWLAMHPMLPALMGLIGGPLAYYTGLRLGAVEYLTDPLLISCLLGIIWAIALSILVIVSRIDLTRHSSIKSSTSSQYSGTA